MANTASKMKGDVPKMAKNTVFTPPAASSGQKASIFTPLTPSALKPSAFYVRI
jgi:hypothetical protein